MILPGSESFRLRNNLRLLYVPSHLPLTYVSAYVEAGEAHETVDYCGAGDLVLGACFERNLRQRMESLGIIPTAGINSTRTRFDLCGTDLGAMLGCLSQMIRRPLFEEEGIVAGMNRTQRLQAKRCNHLDTIAFNGLRKLMYVGSMAMPEHSMAFSLDVEEVGDFWLSLYRPDVTTVVVSSSTEPSETIGLVNDHFGDWHNDAVAMRRIEANDVYASNSLRHSCITKPDASAAKIIFDAPNITESLFGTMPGDPALMLAMAILGRGTASRYCSWVLENGLCAGANTDSYFGCFGMHHAVGATTKDENVADVIGYLWRQMRFIAEGCISDEELQRARQYSITSLLSCTWADPAYEIGMAHLYGMPDLALRPQELFAGVSLSDVAEQMALLLPHFRAVVVTGNEQTSHEAESLLDDLMR